MRSIKVSDVVLSLLAVLLIGGFCVSSAAAASPAPAMAAHLWINGLPQGQLVLVTVADHAGLNYVGGQGRYDFLITGRPGEDVRVLVNGTEVQNFTFAPGTTAYLNLTDADGTITASAYDPEVPMPTPCAPPCATPVPETEHTGLDLGGSWVFAVATMMSLVVVGCFATVRRKMR